MFSFYLLPDKRIRGKKKKEKRNGGGGRGKKRKKIDRGREPGHWSRRKFERKKKRESKLLVNERRLTST